MLREVLSRRGTKPAEEISLPGHVGCCCLISKLVANSRSDITSYFIRLKSARRVHDPPPGALGRFSAPTPRRVILRSSVQIKSQKPV